jgi:hypothetical protein
MISLVCNPHHTTDDRAEIRTLLSLRAKGTVPVDLPRKNGSDDDESINDPRDMGKMEVGDHITRRLDREGRRLIIGWTSSIS